MKQAGNGAGHAGGAVAETRLLGIDLAGGIQEHVACGSKRSHLAVVDGDDFLLGRERDEHEAAAAEIARLGMCNRQRKADRHGGIDRIPTLPQNIDTNIGREPLLCRYHAVFRDRRVEPRLGSDQRIRRRIGGALRGHWPGGKPDREQQSNCQCRAYRPPPPLPHVEPRFAGCA